MAQTGEILGENGMFADRLNAVRRLSIFLDGGAAERYDGGIWRAMAMAKNGFMDVRITVRDGETGEESSFWLSEASGYDGGEICAAIPGQKHTIDIRDILSPENETGLSLVKAEALMRGKTEDPS